jgi:cytochrome P450
LGEALARMTLFLGAAFLLQRFTFTKVPGEVYSFEPKRRTEAISIPPNYKVCVLPRF